MAIDWCRGACEPQDRDNCGSDQSIDAVGDGRLGVDAKGTDITRLGVFEALETGYTCHRARAAVQLSEAEHNTWRRNMSTLWQDSTSCIAIQKSYPYASTQQSTQAPMLCLHKTLILQYILS
jgi:hypothetical protein